MNRAFIAIAVGLSLYLVTASASAATEAVPGAGRQSDTGQRATDCANVARFYALMLQGQKLIGEGQEPQAESFITRAKQLPLNERQRAIQRDIRSSIAAPDRSYLQIYRACWNGYYNLTARHDAPHGDVRTPDGRCRCEEQLCDTETPNFDS